MKVLLGIGGSEDSLRALEQVADRTVEADDDLTVAIVENPDSDRTPAAVEEQVRAALSERGLDPDADVEVRHLEGDPGPQLVELADTGGYDQLVLGGGERSPMGKIAVGDIAEFVIVNARTTVTLVR
jgi:nucleotide-binding universal stress UspA family protein